MSSSDAKPIGTIFLGPTPDRETTLERLYSNRPKEQWTQSTEEMYLQRVREKAAEKVRELLAQAQARALAMKAEAQAEADKVQAEAQAMKQQAIEDAAGAKQVRQQADILRQAAHQEGYEVGYKEAMASLDQTKAALGETTAVVLLSIHQQCGSLFEAWRTDMSALFIDAVEKATHWIVTEERKQVLQALLQDSMLTLLDKRRFVVKVNPMDAALLTDMLAEANHGRTEELHWELSSDADLEPGSLVVESDSGLVDNSRASRQAVVNEVLERLTLPLSEADQIAFSHVADVLTAEMSKHDIQLAQEGAHSPEALTEAAPGDVPGSAEDFAPLESGALPPILTPTLDEMVDTESVVQDIMDTAFAPTTEAPLEDTFMEEALPMPAADPVVEMPDMSDMPEILEEQEALPPAMEAESNGPELVEIEDPALMAPSGQWTAVPDNDDALSDDLANELLADLGFGPEEKKAG